MRNADLNGSALECSTCRTEGTVPPVLTPDGPTQGASGWGNDGEMCNQGGGTMYRYVRVGEWLGVREQCGEMSG